MKNALQKAEGRRNPMLVIAVDNDEASLKKLASCITEALPRCILMTYGSSSEAMKFIEGGGKPDITFLETEMKEMDGISLAKEIRARYPRKNIIFCTKNPDFALDAFGVAASGYMIKPVDTEAVLEQLKTLRFPLDGLSFEPVLEARCFGNFEVRLNGMPLSFQHSKTKEFLAYLIDRNGAMTSAAEIMTALWEDDEEHLSYYKEIKRDLTKTLDSTGIENLILKQWGHIGINREKIKCDYFDWLDGKTDPQGGYHGEYMSQYSWAEYTQAALWNEE